MCGDEPYKSRKYLFLTLLLSVSTLLRVTNNSAEVGNALVRRGLEALRRRLPPGWSVEAAAAPRDQFDAVATFVAPDRRSARVLVEAKQLVDPRTVVQLSHVMKAARVGMPVLVLSRFIAESTRTRLREEGFLYADETGNVWLTLQEPGLYVEASGAPSDPERAERPARSLKGQKASRVVRALCDFSDPPGVRELASRAEVDPGYVSRILVLLDREALVTRDDRGRVARVDWEKLLRRWSSDAPIDTRGRSATFLEPRGLDALTARVSVLGDRYAVTGSLAAARLAPVAPARLATLYVPVLDDAAKELSLRPMDAGANVILIEPEDTYVFARAVDRNGLRCSAPSQVAADLMTSPGRGPAEAEELLRWMKEHEGAWRRG